MKHAHTETIVELHGFCAWSDCFKIGDFHDGDLHIQMLMNIDDWSLMLACMMTALCDGSIIVIGLVQCCLIRNTKLMTAIDVTFALVT